MESREVTALRQALADVLANGLRAGQADGSGSGSDLRVAAQRDRYNTITITQRLELDKLQTIITAAGHGATNTDPNNRACRVQRLHTAVRVAAWCSCEGPHASVAQHLRSWVLDGDGVSATHALACRVKIRDVKRGRGRQSGQ